MNNTPEITWGYLAGFFDGEGCIHFLKRPYGKYCIVQITQGWQNEENSNIIHLIYEFLLKNDIRANLRSYRYDSGWRVIVSSTRGCRLYLEKMLPYLIVKRQKAINFLEFMNITRDTRIDPKMRREIIELRAQNLSITKIAKIVGVNFTTVKYNLIKYSDYQSLHHRKRKYNKDNPRLSAPLLECF